MKTISKADKKLIKKINTVSILKTIREYGPISRADISKTIGLNPATVSSIVTNLLKNKSIKEVGIGKSSGGRKPVLLELNSDELYVVGVDVGITKVTTGLININGNILNKTTIDFKDKTVETIFEAIKSSIYEVIKEHDKNFNNVIGIGMGVHGLIDTERGMSIYAPAFNWNNVNIVDTFKKEFNVPVLIDNDARVMALGEKWFGYAKNSKNFVLLNIGTGVGAGVFINDALYRGNNFGAGEVGHIKITDENIKCRCGRYGCLEAMVSGRAIVNRFIKGLEKGRTSSLKDRLKTSDITSLEIYREALKGDLLSIEVLKETGKYIGIGISTIINTLNPSMILIAGGVSKAGDFIYDEIQNTISKKSMNNNLKNVYIGETKLKDNVGIVGAGSLIIKDIFSI
ncbi:ROK family transcriptional regulator [Dethiothermospora halolimnae]|uniref:ROK family transcriptional regulator n=1 Tax=Dethiothermospora halolimnae TaxID=3114390 RepID=UPI003CCB9837